MSHVPQEPTPGQATDPSIITPKNDVSELIAVLDTNVKAIVRIGAVLTKFSERLDALEGEPAPVTERRPLDPSPRLALRSDGAVLVEVTSDIEEADLVDREVRRYATLTTAEAYDAVDRADAALGDVAARAGWQLARARKGYPDAPSSPTEPTL
jgi:hypothetical protein